MEERAGPAPTAVSPAAPAVKIPVFGARAKARQLATEVHRLTNENASLRQEIARLKSDMARLGVLTVVELEHRRDQLTGEIVRQTADLEEQRKRHAAALERQAAETAARLRNEVAAAEARKIQLEGELKGLQRQVVMTAETALLQEVGIYEYRHPLTDAVAYQQQLTSLQEQIKSMAKTDGGAVLAIGSWTVNGSVAQGRTMVRDYSKLMLRAYNAEADNLVRSLKPYMLGAAIDRLTKVAETIARLGKTMNIRISEPYHRLRVKELELTADYRAKVAEEKERQREEKARLREERRVQQEIERERARLQKERQHYANALAALTAKGDDERAARLRAQLEEIEHAIEDVDYRAANVRAGYVYVISNLGSFGERMVKIGMTRRLDPRDRVRELSDASVPFNFDVHALFFSEDAVGIEAELHRRFADRRVNRVNQRREFFYATPQEVKEVLKELAGDLLEYEETPEALEYRQSLTEAKRDQAAAAGQGRSDVGSGQVSDASTHA